MRRVLALFLLSVWMAIPTGAAAQCGFTSIAPGDGGFCGIAADDGVPTCDGFFSEAAPPAYAVDAIVNSADLLVWIKDSDQSLAYDGTTYEGAVCKPLNTCNGGSRFEEDCIGHSECPGASCTSEFGSSTKCLGGPDHADACTTNADCDEFFEDGFPVGGSYVGIAVSESGAAACAIAAGGTLGCWGELGAFASGICIGTNGYPAWGTACSVESDCTIGSNALSTCILGMPPEAGSYTQIDAAYGHFCGLKSDGSVDCWGYRLAGTPNYASWSSESSSTDFVHVEVATGYACGLKGDGTIECWGDDEDGNFASNLTPPAGTFSSFALVDGLGCARRVSDNGITCWGDVDSYTGLFPETCDWAAVFSGESEMCFLDTEGNAACFWSGSTSECAIDSTECGATTTTTTTSTTTTTTTTTTTLPRSVVTFFAVW
jgi:hypothetical protein